MLVSFVAKKSTHNRALKNIKTIIESLPDSFGSTKVIRCLFLL